jgi:hypothetical protein
VFLELSVELPHAFEQQGGVLREVVGTREGGETKRRGSTSTHSESNGDLG